MNQKSFANIVLVKVIVAIVVVGGCFALTKKQTPSAETQELSATNQNTTTQTPSPEEKAGLTFGKGLFVMLHKKQRPLEPIDYKYLSGAQFGYTWLEVEPKEGEFRWDEFDATIKMWADKGKKCMIGVALGDLGKGGQATPEWLFDRIKYVTVRGSHEADYPKPEVQADKKIKYVTVRGSHEENLKIPVYWDETFLSYYKRLIQEFATKYDGDPRIEMVGIYLGEFATTRLSASTVKRLKEEGYTSELWFETIKKVCRLYQEAFKKTPLKISVSAFATQREPDWEQWIEKVIEYAASNGINIYNHQLSGEGAKHSFAELPYARLFNQVHNKYPKVKTILGTDNPLSSKGYSEAAGKIADAVRFAIGDTYDSKGRYIPKTYISYATMYYNDIVAAARGDEEFDKAMRYIVENLEPKDGVSRPQSQRIPIQGEGEKGIYALMPANQPIDKGILGRLPASVPGISIRSHWFDIEPVEGRFNWEYFDGAIKAAQEAGKEVILRVYVVGKMRGLPEWVKERITTFEYEDKDGEIKHIPIPWDEEFLKSWGNFVTAFGERYDNEPSVVLIQICLSRGGEMHLPHSPGDIKRWKEVGYTKERLEDAWKRAIDIYMDAFKNKSIGINISPQIDKDSDEISANVLSYGVNRYGKQFHIQGNWLHSKTNEEWHYYRLLKEYSKKTVVGFQMLTSATTGGDRQGSLLESFDKGLKAGASYFEVYSVDTFNPKHKETIDRVAKRLNP